MSVVDRKAMERALKDGCVPELRRAGFRGEFPNFYRESEGFIALVNFQFYSAGGSFCVNLSFADPERTNIFFRPETQPSKLKVSQANERIRLGSRVEGDNWYSFGKTTYGELRGQPIPVTDVLSNINELMASQAEDWWKLKRESYCQQTA